MLTGLSVFWFELTAGDRPQPPDLGDRRACPASVRGRALAVQRLEMLPIECVVRGYLAAPAGTTTGAAAPCAGSRCPRGCASPTGCREPLFTPATKAADRRSRREHRLRGARSATIGDRAPGGARARRVDRRLRARRRARARARHHRRRHEVRVRPRARRHARARRRGADARLLALLGRRRATSRGARSRASTSSSCATGRPRSGWDRSPPAPPIPDEVVAGTTARYRDAYERIVGEPLDAWLARSGAPASDRAGRTRD